MPPERTPPADTVTFDRRFVGPPGSANGGYACGTAAVALTAGPAEVTLHRPPPVGRPLRIEREGGTLTLQDGDELILTARSAEVPGGLPEPVSLEDALGAAGRFDADDYAARHPFPTCFTCGPGRGRGDGLRIFPAPVEGRVDTVAWPWTPATAVGDRDGLVPVPVLWAALDCPSGLARFGSGEDLSSNVLGRMTAAVHRRPAVGDEVVVAGWTRLQEGRKLHAGAAIWSPSGEVMAESRAVWIALSEEQKAAFGVARG